MFAAALSVRATALVARTVLANQAGAPQTVHLAFRASSRSAVAAFHEAALAAGGRGNGDAGPRESYGPTYFAAFALDPDGNNVEAVTHEP